MKLRILAAVLNQHQLDLYQENGEVFVIKQGDARLAQVLAEIKPFLDDGQIAEIELGKSDDISSDFAEFEGRTGGLIRFFKVVKSALDTFINETKDVYVKPGQEVIYGTVPSKNPAVASVTVGKRGGAVPDEKPTKAAKTDKAIAEIMAHAIPSSDKEFKGVNADQHNEKGHLSQEGTETIVAVVGDQVLGGVEKLGMQVSNAVKDKHSQKGLQAFITRMAAVAKERRHSMDDLLKFIERGDLPIADDGSIVAYKVLNRKDKKHTTFYDCHTGNVPQKVGSYVHMDHSLVDHDRRNECSNGLHIARRGYLRTFGGDVCVICKINPEDVIAVPEYDANKIRVCGYHIVEMLTDDEYRKVKADQAMTDDKSSATKLGGVLAGLHIGITEKVKIGGHKGTKINITPVVAGKAKKAAVQKVTSGRKAEALKVKEKAEKAAAVDANAVAKSSLQTKEAGKSARAVRAAELINVMNSMTTPTSIWLAAKDVVAFKTKAKVSWEKLEVSIFEAERIVTLASTEPAFEEEAPVVETKPVKVKAKPAAAKSTGKKPAAVTDKARALKVLLEKVVQKQDKKAATELLDAKRKSKKSWLALGLPKETGEACLKVLAKKK